jgi:hypothetical protein
MSAAKIHGVFAQLSGSDGSRRAAFWLGPLLYSVLYVGWARTPEPTQVDGVAPVQVICCVPGQGVRPVEGRQYCAFGRAVSREVPLARPLAQAGSSGRTGRRARFATIVEYTVYPGRHITDVQCVAG